MCIIRLDQLARIRIAIDKNAKYKLQRANKINVFFFGSFFLSD